jgi:AcrR family transcriptional regulator
MKNRIVKDDLRYLLFTEIYHRLEEPKANRRAFGLIEAALECFSRKGFENVTLEMIAREAGATRPSLRRYFRDLDDIREIAIKYVRLRFQKHAVGSMSKGQSVPEMLTAYVDACFKWPEQQRTHSKVWMAFLHLCTHHRYFRNLNTRAVNVGEERIASLLELGRKNGQLKLSDANQVNAAAMAVQTIITGGMVAAGTQNFENPEIFLLAIRDQCLKLAGA